MKNVSRLFLVVAVVLLICAQPGMAQNGVQAGISASGNVLSIHAKPVNTITGQLFSSLNVTVRWLMSLGTVTLGTTSGSYGIIEQGTVTNDGTYYYESFGSTPNATITWAAGSDNVLFTVPVNGAAGTGSFELTDIGHAWYFEINGSDSTDPGAHFYAQSVSGVTLPIQLASFTALTLSKTSVKLSWETLSETNNYGFEVQRSTDGTTFTSISGAFIAGNGTTTAKHDYSYVDNDYASGNFYRLKQMDLSAAVHYSDAVNPQSTTAIAPPAKPTVYSMSQNYPNPFNPSTNIDFTLPQDSHVRIEVYNMIGQKVMTLMDEAKTAGYYTVKLDGTNLASGMYIYRLSTGQHTFLKRLLLLK